MDASEIPSLNLFFFYLEQKQQQQKTPKLEVHKDKKKLPSVSLLILKTFKL